MNKKLLVYTLTAFFLLGIYLRYFFYSQQNTNTNLEELDKVVYFSGKTSEFAVEPEDSDSICSTGELVQIENLFKNKSVDELQQLVFQLQKLGDLEKAIEAYKRGIEQADKYKHASMKREFKQEIEILKNKLQKAWKF